MWLAIYACVPAMIIDPAGQDAGDDPPAVAPSHRVRAIIITTGGLLIVVGTALPFRSTAVAPLWS